MDGRLTEARPKRLPRSRDMSVQRLVALSVDDDLFRHRARMN
jgi:hypothetical protein